VQSALTRSSSKPAIPTVTASPVIPAVAASAIAASLPAPASANAVTVRQIDPAQPPNVGFKMGINQCYMVAVLQQLIRIPSLAAAILSSDSSKQVSPVVHQLKALLNNLAATNDQ